MTLEDKKLSLLSGFHQHGVNHIAKKHKLLKNKTAQTKSGNLVFLDEILNSKQIITELSLSDDYIFKLLDSNFQSDQIHRQQNFQKKPAEQVHS